MATDKLEQELKRFIQEHIHSIRQLEALIYVYQNAKQDHTASSLALALRANEWATAGWLEGFRVQGLVVTTVGPPALFRYNSSSPALDKIMTQLSNEYKVRPLKVIDTFLAQPETKMRDFMDAFKIKKESKDDDS